VVDSAGEVLRDDGVLWLNLGDCYSTHPAGLTGEKRWAASTINNRDRTGAEQAGAFDKRVEGLKEKDLVGVPWMVAFELRRRGWHLRAAVVWWKRNPSPESVQDRPTRDYEDVFMLTKSAETLFWTHRDGRGTRKRPEPDYVWQDLRDGGETRDPPEGWETEEYDATERYGPDSLTPGEPRGEPKTAPRWRRLNLWRGHDYYYDQDAVRQPLADASVLRLSQATLWDQHGGEKDFANGTNPNRSARRSLENLAIRSGYAPSTLAEIGEDYRGAATKEYDGTGAQDPSDTKRRVIAGMRRRADAGLPPGANLRSVWDIPTQPFREAHFATFPAPLPERCILIGSPEAGSCPACGAPWARTVRTENGFIDGVCPGCGAEESKHVVSAKSSISQFGADADRTGRAVACGARFTTGWAPTCDCDAGEPVPAVVMDFFSGSGTTVTVARQRGRRSIGIDLNPKYVGMAERRSSARTPDITATGEAA
jgi:DNA methylase